jgi:hypothetical protein
LMPTSLWQLRRPLFAGDAFSWRTVQRPSTTSCILSSCTTILLMRMTPKQVWKESSLSN